MTTNKKDMVLTTNQLPNDLVSNPAPTSGFYLELNHGRKDPSVDMTEVGTTCPDILGPFGHIRHLYVGGGRLFIESTKTVVDLGIELTKEECLDLPPNTLCRHEDMLFWNGVWYGDWTFLTKDQRNPLYAKIPTDKRSHQ